jgi:hypothetical protein
MVTITNTGKASVGFGREPRTTLIPGENQVDPEAWATAKKHPAIAAHVESGMLVEEGAPSKKKPSVTAKKTVEIVTAFGKLSVAKAIEMVKDAKDVGVLKACLQAEEREDVFEAIETRLQELS